VDAFEGIGSHGHFQSEDFHNSNNSAQKCSNLKITIYDIYIFLFVVACINHNYTVNIINNLCISNRKHYLPSN
jgi:hypothetical protein